MLRGFVAEEIFDLSRPLGSVSLKNVHLLALLDHLQDLWLERPSVNQNETIYQFKFIDI